MNAKLKSARPLAVAVLTAGLLSGVCFGEEPRTETVRFSDLNVNTQAGIAALYGRIHRAAAHVCAENDPLRRAAAAACMRQAEGHAVDVVQLATLTAYYNAKTGEHRVLLSANR